MNTMQGWSPSDSPKAQASPVVSPGSPPSTMIRGPLHARSIQPVLLLDSARECGPFSSPLPPRWLWHRFVKANSPPTSDHSQRNLHRTCTGGAIPTRTPKSVSAAVPMSQQDGLPHDRTDVLCLNHKIVASLIHCLRVLTTLMCVAVDIKQLACADACTLAELESACLQTRECSALCFRVFDRSSTFSRVPFSRLRCIQHGE